MITKIDEFIISLFQKYLVNLTGKKPIWLAQQCVYLMGILVLYGEFFISVSAFNIISGVLMVAIFWLQTHHEQLWDITHKSSRTPLNTGLRMTVLILWFVPLLILAIDPNVSVGAINTALVWSTVFAICYLETCENPPPPEPKRKLVLDNS